MKDSVAHTVCMYICFKGFIVIVIVLYFITDGILMENKSQLKRRDTKKKIKKEPLGIHGSFICTRGEKGSAVKD